MLDSRRRHGGAKTCGDVGDGLSIIPDCLLSGVTSNVEKLKGPGFNSALVPNPSWKAKSKSTSLLIFVHDSACPHANEDIGATCRFRDSISPSIKLHVL